MDAVSSGGRASCPTHAGTPGPWDPLRAAPSSTWVQGSEGVGCPQALVSRGQQNGHPGCPTARCPSGCSPEPLGGIC